MCIDTLIPSMKVLNVMLLYKSGKKSEKVVSHVKLIAIRAHFFFLAIQSEGVARSRVWSFL